MDRVAVVTGGAAGMGAAICRRLAEQGCRVAVLDLDGDAAEHTAKELRVGGATTIAATVDVSDRAAVDATLARVRDELGSVAIMVTSAGIDRFESFTDIAVESWDRMLAVNLTGTFHCIQSAIPDMVAAKWGRVVTISSSSAQSGSRRMAHY
ncbi:MAG TPA: SDR family NAD(P)-dependent oxidoreductase, partial [Acidimicrobiia bacterium]|nr:SDR family NAD(P)-dependent oxidoreductase [Acidimicrobiia bacterium]